MESYFLQKTLWTEKDFEQMGWHDATVYGFIISPVSDFDMDLIFDIDYIFKWVEPKTSEGFYDFWVSPCTLKFENIFDLKIDYDGSSFPGMDISDLELIQIKDDFYHWNLKLHNGEISFWSSGFKQFVRQKPILTGGQSLTLKQRNGINFKEIAYEN